MAIDKVLTEFRDRLANHSDLLDLLVCFEPDSEDFLNPKLTVNLGQQNDSHFDVVALENFRNQTATAKHFMRSKHPKDITDIFTELNVLPASFDQLIKLIKIIITLPVTTASNELFFSALKRVKSYVRTTTGNERISSRLLMTVDNEFVKYLDIEKLVVEFGRLRSRRYSVT